MSLAAPWLAEVGVITARDLVAEHRPPYPKELLASFVVFGFLGALAVPAPKAAAAAGWGIVLATVLASQTDWLGPVGDFLAGKPTPATDPGGAQTPPPAGWFGGVGSKPKPQPQPQPLPVITSL